MLAVLAGSGRHLLVDAQGPVRASAIGPLQRDAQVDPAVFASLSALKLNEDEARVLCGGVDADRLRRLGVPEILVTLGSAGALVVTATESERIPPVPLGAVVDPTGAGDSFCAAVRVRTGARRRACGGGALGEYARGRSLGAGGRRLGSPRVLANERAPAEPLSFVRRSCAY